MERSTVPVFEPAPPDQTLDQWLGANAAQPLVLLGATGHLELTADEETNVARQLNHRVLPELFAAGDTDVVLVSGLAPGADLIVAETIAAWLARQGRRCRRLGLLPVPAEILWDDWRRRVPDATAEHLAAVRSRFEANLRACDGIVRLWDERAPPDWSDPPVRQRHYRRLAACLVEQCEVLVAVLRPGRARQPGGTSEIVAWRRQAEVPAEFSTGPRRHRSPWAGGDRLVVVDPTVTAGAEAAGSAARNALRAGNYLLCYDLVMKAQQQGHADDELQYLKILALANAGSTEAALGEFERLRATLTRQDEDWLALEGRLHKDLALRGGAGAARHFALAADAYRAAALRTGGYFSAVNAATMTLLAGDGDGARRLAADLLERLGRFRPGDDADRYYLCATEAEAALLLRDRSRAGAALRAADALLPHNVNARSRTRQQLRLLCRVLALDDDVLAALRVAPVLYLPPQAVAPVIPAPAAAFAYAGITEPRELEAAEALLPHGARLHLVLAAPPEKMRARWAAVHGAGWTRRFDRLLEQAVEVSVARGFLEHEDAWCDGYVGAMALGLSRLAARRLGCAWQSLGADGRWLDPEDAAAPATGAPAEPAPPNDAGAARYSRRFAGIIFADFAGFSALPDGDLPPFWAQFMRPIGERLTAHRADILLKHTWGDALHVITTTARAAADVACEIQRRLDEVRPSLAGGGLAALELRVSAHYGPVFCGHDPVERRGTYFGTPLSFAARIEPVTPPGMIFVTEAFAAQLALEAPAGFVLEYAGELRLAKAYGESRLFSLRRAAAPA